MADYRALARHALRPRRGLAVPAHAPRQYVPAARRCTGWIRLCF